MRRIDETILCGVKICTVNLVGSWFVEAEQHAGEKSVITQHSRHSSRLKRDARVTNRKKDSKKAAIPAELRRRMQTEAGEWLGFRMVAISNYFTYEPRNIIAERHGLVGDEMTVLANLYDWGGMTANVICALTGRPKNSISRAVIRLTDQKLIAAQTDAHDRRRILLAITKEGAALYEQATAPFVEQEQKMFGVLTPRERDELSNIMFKILRGWSEEFVDEES